jgi:hypothetical protein
MFYVYQILNSALSAWADVIQYLTDESAPEDPDTAVRSASVALTLIDAPLQVPLGP